MRYRKIAFKIFIGIFFLIFTSTPLWSGEPGDVVKGVILKDISLKDGEDTNERKHKLWEEISLSFNFEEMAKRAMWNHWEKRSPDEKKEFVELFTNNIKAAYIRKSGSRFGEKIISLMEKQGDKFAKVQVELINKTEGKMSADFFLLRKNLEWRIYDVVFEGVSLVSNYRRQFNSFLSKFSYEELVQKLKQNQSKKEHGNQKPGFSYIG
jgi:phospholipid transport system substrate-binding protein